MDKGLEAKHLESPFTAILLAAGVGSRIRELTDEPKCLLRFGDETILSRHLRIWKELGIKNVTLVVGHKKEMIFKEIEGKWERDFNFTIVENLEPTKYGNTVSLQLGLEKSKGAILIFDADLVYDLELLHDFLKNGNSSEILVGKADISDIECAKTLVDSGNFVRMTVDKRAITQEELLKYRFAGEAIGILKFGPLDTEHLKEACDLFLRDEKNLGLNWEHLMNVFLLKHDVGVYESPPHYKWIEIDTPDDFEHGIELFF